MVLHIDQAHSDDKSAIVDLLRRSQLLTEDLPATLTDFVIAKEDNVLIGVAGLERFETLALLRSVAVDPRCQGQQIGAKLIARLLNTAQSTGLDEVYLITTTADRYFERHSFKPVDRQDVPEVLRQTQQFSGLCPSSAIVMKRSMDKTT